MPLFPHLIPALENIYISPLETCNLNCRLCYTPKTKNILTNKQILNFVRRYDKHLTSDGFCLRSIIFCGGEVFTLPNFPRLVNNLIKKGLFITIITNGTIDKLDFIRSPHNCQLLVSFDGPRSIHDANRGVGNFDKSQKFIRHALSLGFPVEIMYLVTPTSYPFIDSFNIFNLKNNFITIKSKFFSHQLKTPGLTPAQIINLKQNYPSVPPKNLGCFQLSLQSDGLIYGCCESPQHLAKISYPIPKIIKNFVSSLSTCRKCPISTLKITKLKHSLKIENCKLKIKCHGCCDPKFLCGYKQELRLLSCKDVVKSFHGS